MPTFNQARSELYKLDEKENVVYCYSKVTRYSVKILFSSADGCTPESIYGFVPHWDATDVECFNDAITIFKGENTIRPLEEPEK